MHIDDLYGLNFYIFLYHDGEYYFYLTRFE